MLKIKVQLIVITLLLSNLNVHCAEQKKMGEFTPMIITEDTQQQISKPINSEKTKALDEKHILDARSKQKLILAVETNNLTYINNYINECQSIRKKPNLDVKDRDGFTLLMIAANKSYNEMFKLLLENGADHLIENIENSIEGFSLLQTVIEKGSVFALELLLPKLSASQIYGQETIEGFQEFENKIKELEKEFAKMPNDFGRINLARAIEFKRNILAQMKKLFDEKYELDEPFIFQITKRI